MFLDLCFERAAFFAATPRRKQRIMNRGGVDLEVTRQAHRVEGSVVNDLRCRIQLERTTESRRVETSKRVDDGDSQLITCAVGELNEGHPLGPWIPPVDRFDVECERGN